MPPRLFGAGGQLWGTLRALATTAAIAMLALGLSGGQSLDLPRILHVLARMQNGAAASCGMYHIHWLGACLPRNALSPQITCAWC